MKKIAVSFLVSIVLITLLVPLTGAIAKTLSTLVSITSPPGAVDGIVSTGQTFTISATITANGGTANDVAAAISLPSGYTLAAGELATHRLGNIANGTSTITSWRVVAPSSVTPALTITVTPHTTSEGFTIQAGTTSVSTMAAASLHASLTATPNPADNGQKVTITMTVTNKGESNAEKITPSTLTVSATGTAYAILDSGPVPTSVSSLEGGSSTIFQWTYKVHSSTSGESITFSGTVGGADENSGLTVTSGPTSVSITVVRITVLTTSIMLSVGAGEQARSSIFISCDQSKTIHFTKSSGDAGDWITLGASGYTFPQGGGNYILTFTVNVPLRVKPGIYTGHIYIGDPKDVVVTINVGGAVGFAEFLRYSIISALELLVAVVLIAVVAKILQIVISVAWKKLRKLPPVRSSMRKPRCLESYST
ncbi:hypothetical protein KEJ26_07105 [Candidatus Bathyarchaeota archaeon]|nr:hypothetical protein [Candidatus Bathyarchaeota archaeon]